MSQSFIYGPAEMNVEQINNSTAATTYLHHDQQGSTRLLIDSTGTVTGTTTFDAYGNKTGATGTSTTPLGYDGQYTSTDTGLIYLRARVYDPATAQFLSVDPAVSLTGAPYNFTRPHGAGLSDERWIWLGLSEGMDHDGASRSDRSGGDDRVYDYRYR